LVSGGAGGNNFDKIQQTIFLLIVFAPRLQPLPFIKLERISVAVHFRIAALRTVKLKRHFLLEYLVAHDTLDLFEGFCF